MISPITIGSRLEPLWDDYLIDTDATTAKRVLHRPSVSGVVTFDRPWMTGHNSPYMCLIQTGGVIRLYTMPKKGIAVSESEDGVSWRHPELGLVEFEGSKKNSLIRFDYSETGYEPCGFDGFRVFVDESPDCPEGERIKAIANMHDRLQVYVSSDGYTFVHKGEVPVSPVCENTPYDSINTVFWDTEAGKYKAFVRDYFTYPDGECIRAISCGESATLQPKCGWPRSTFLRYDNDERWQMYINSVMPYFRAPHVYIGFPSRYVIHKSWDPAFDELCGREARRARAGEDGTNRLGVSVSDTLFMVSRDGYDWIRYPDAFLRPGPEHPTNWVYGSVYFPNGLAQTPSLHPGCDDELSFWCMENRFFTDLPPTLSRYTIRMDGFVSRSSEYPSSRLVTKPLIFEGGELHVNMSTSAWGSVVFRLRDADGNTAGSAAMFGDSTDKRVVFDGDISRFAGRPVTLECDMRDADLYSIRFA